MLRRIGSNALIATDMSLADYGAALGQRADQIAKEDPLVPPHALWRCCARFRFLPRLSHSVTPDSCDSRPPPLKLAPSPANRNSTRAAWTPDARSNFHTVGSWECDSSRPTRSASRVSSRYPLADALPGRPATRSSSHRCGARARLGSESSGGGAYVSTARNVLSVTDASSAVPRFPTVNRTLATPTPYFQPSYVPLEVAEARAFEEPPALRREKWARFWR